MNHLGIDISKDRLDVYCLERQAYQSFGNSKAGFKKLETWLAGQGCELKQSHVVMEATGVYWEDSAHWLHKQGMSVSVVNPASVKHFARSKLRRGKTDKMDAQLLADYAQTMQPRRWQPEAAEIEDLRQLSRSRETLVKQRTEQRNRLKAHKHHASPNHTVSQLLQKQLDFTQKQIKALDEALRKLLSCQALKFKADLLLSIPGIGLQTVAVLLAETSGMSFLNPKQLTAYAGISPEPNQSGKRTGRASISKTGNPRIRKNLYMAALSASTKDGFKALYDRLLAKGKAKKLALVAVARKLLVTAFAIIQSLTPYDPDYLSNRLSKLYNTP